MRTALTTCAFACCLTLCSAPARGGEPDARLARQRIALLDKIRDEGSAAKRWREIIGYLRTGPTYPVRRRCGLLLAKVRTGKFWRLLGPVSASPASLAVTPSLFRSMPSSVFALIEFRSILFPAPAVENRETPS